MINWPRLFKSVNTFFLNTVRYKEHEDGVLRLQTVRFESVELSQQLNATEDSRGSNIPASPLAPEQNSSSSMIGSQIEGADVGSGEHKENGERSVSNVETYRNLLEQYEEEHEGQALRRSQHNSPGPVRRGRQFSNHHHPYERAEEIVSQTLLALQEAAVHLVRH